MKKTILLFGLIIGILLSTNAIIHMNMIYNNPDYKPNNVLGYATLIGLFSIIYFGLRMYRNNHLDGKINFLQAFKVGALICFLASTVYVVIGLIYYYFFAPDFIDVFTDFVIKNSPPDQLETTTAQMASFKEMYKNPILVVLITYMEVMPIGMIVALIWSFIVKKK